MERRLTAPVGPDLGSPHGQGARRHHRAAPGLHRGAARVLRRDRAARGRRTRQRLPARHPRHVRGARRRKNRTSLDGLRAFDDDPLDWWSKLEGLAAIRERLGAQIDGWEFPASYALAVDGDFPHVNQPGGVHKLPAAVLGTVLKHDGSTATLEVSRQQLDEAITTLGPAAACTDIDHPNLAAWRAIAERLDANGGGTVTAVFVRSVDDPVGSELDAALRAAW